MLEIIRNALHAVVYMEQPPIPRELRNLFTDAWGDADQSFEAAKRRLAVSPILFRIFLEPRLRRAGLTGEMLTLKEASLQFHVNRLVGGGIITYPDDPTLWERIKRFGRPAFKAMNSVLGSLSSVLPVLEIAREYKDHVELTVEAMEEGEEEPA
jgi:hypothetical protein